MKKTVLWILALLLVLALIVPVVAQVSSHFRPGLAPAVWRGRGAQLGELPDRRRSRAVG